MKITKKQIEKNLKSLGRNNYQVTINEVYFNNFGGTSASKCIVSHPENDFDTELQTYVHSKVTGFPGVIMSAYTKAEFINCIYRIVKGFDFINEKLFEITNESVKVIIK